MDIELLIDKDKLAFFKESKIDVKNYKTKLKINEKIYNCIFENYSITDCRSTADKIIKLSKTFSKIILEDIMLDLSTIRELEKCSSKVIINKMNFYINFEIDGMTNDFVHINTLRFIEI